MNLNDARKLSLDQMLDQFSLTEIKYNTDNNGTIRTIECKFTDLNCASDSDSEVTTKRSEMKNLW